jgi:predicted methyltransferase
MRYTVAIFISLLITIMPSTDAAADTSSDVLERSNRVAQAIADPSRPDFHLARDNVRKPEEVLKLIGARPGEKIGDIGAGSGYYTALLSRIVGDDGKIYAVNPLRLFEEYPELQDAFPQYLAQDPRTNVVASDQLLDELKFPEPLDRVLMILYYHDTIWTGEDRLRMNRAIFDALKPGGIYFVLDHHGNKNITDDDIKMLHRMDAEIIRPEIIEAGFDFVGESNLLENPDDPHTASVFDPTWRGKTDRFIYIFMKPSK